MTITLDATKIARINKMNEASRKAEMGTLLGTLETEMEDMLPLPNLVQTIGNHAHVVIEDEQTAGEVLVFDRTESGLAISTYIVQVYRSDVLMSNIKVVVDGFTLKVKTNGSDYVVTTGDIICAIVF